MPSLCLLLSYCCRTLNDINSSAAQTDRVELIYCLLLRVIHGSVLQSTGDSALYLEESESDFTRNYCFDSFLLYLL